MKLPGDINTSMHVCRHRCAELCAHVFFCLCWGPQTKVCQYIKYMIPLSIFPFFPLIWVQSPQRAQWTVGVQSRVQSLLHAWRTASWPWMVTLSTRLWQAGLPLLPHGLNLSRTVQTPIFNSPGALKLFSLCSYPYFVSSYSLCLCPSLPMSSMAFSFKRVSVEAEKWTDL